MLLNLKWTRKNRNYRNGFNLDIETKKRKKNCNEWNRYSHKQKQKRFSFSNNKKFNIGFQYNYYESKIAILCSMWDFFFHSIGINKCEWVWKILSIRCGIDWIIGIANENWLYKRASIISSICDGSFCGEKQWY